MDKMEAMDAAAEQAAQEFDPKWSAAQVQEWWRKHYKAAGHKRLGRILVNKVIDHVTAAVKEVA